MPREKKMAHKFPGVIRARERKLDKNEVMFLVRYSFREKKYHLHIISGNKKLEQNNIFFGHSNCSEEIAKQLLVWRGGLSSIKHLSEKIKQQSLSSEDVITEEQNE